MFFKKHICYFITIWLAAETVFTLENPFVKKFFPTVSEHLAPKSLWHSNQMGIARTTWVTVTEGSNYYSPGELEARIRAIRKAVPLLERVLKNRAAIDPASITAIFATGEYILDPSWGIAGLPRPPQVLDFVVFVDRLPTSKNKKIDLTQVEISPETFFTNGDLGRKSAYHMNITVFPLSRKASLRSVAAVKSYYLGCLLKGENPWKEEPPVDLLQKIIKNLMSDAVKKGFYDIVHWANKMGPAFLLTQRKLPETLRHSSDHLSFPSDLTTLEKIRELITSSYPPKPLGIEESI